MATNKKSFILYADQSQVFNQLPDELAGRLIKHVFAYVNDENPLSDDLIINVAFTPIMLSLKRDLKKWDTYIDKQKVNGAKGGRPKAKETQKTQAFKKEPKKADSVSVSVNDSVSDSVSKKIEQFVPNTASIDAINSSYPNCDVETLITDFKDQATNRAKPFKDLQSGFRNYLRKGWISPHTKTVQQSHSQRLKQLVNSERTTGNPLLMMGVK